MSKLNSLIAERDGLEADYDAYLDDAEATVEVANEKQAAIKSVQEEIAKFESLEKHRNELKTAAKARSEYRTERPFGFSNEKPESKSDLKSFADHITDSGVLKSENFGQKFNVNLKTVLGAGTSNGGNGLTSYDRPAGIVLLGQQQPVVSDLIPQTPTDSPVIRLFVENSFTSDAGMVAENGTKPEGALDLAEKDFPVRKIAVLQPVTDEMLSDYPATSGYLSRRLPYKLSIKEEVQVIQGDGTGQNLLGFLNTPNINTYARVGGATPESNAEAVRKAIAKVQAVGYDRPTAGVVHPLDWDILAREKDNNKQYYGGGPFTGSYGVGDVASNLARYWGLTMVVTTSIPQGTILIGNFANGSQIFRRQSITIDMTNAHASTFAQNVKTFRAEERLALAVTLPKSFCTITNIG